MKLFRFLRTVKYLKIVQIYYQIYRKLYCPHFSFTAVAHRRKALNKFINGIDKENSIAEDFSEVTFLNIAFKINPLADWKIYTDNKLWMYNLHYFNYLMSPNAGKHKVQYNQLIDSWIKHNPLRKQIAWEPYPTSLRIVNWIKWGLMQDSLSPNQLSSLVLQANYLYKRLEYHLLGNHLFANSKALIFAGLFFEGRDSDKWLRRGEKLLAAQIEEQFLADGGHFERSPMYHALLLEDLLDLLNIYQVYGRNFPSEYLVTIQRAFHYLKTLLHPDGEICFFNDAALGVAPTFAELLSYAERLRISLSHCSDKNTGLIESGYYRLRNQKAVLIMDAAPIGPDYMPGHAHADTLSFELSLFGQRCIVNAGTSRYDLSEERLRQRKTESHSTLSIDACDSSEVWSSFRVGRRAKILKADFFPQENKLIASHNGFFFLPDNPIHQREWHLMEETLTIIDEIAGKSAYQHSIVIYYYLHPAVTLLSHNKNHVNVLCNDKEILFTFTENVAIEKANYFPQFNVSKETMRIKATVRSQFPAKFITTIRW